MRIINLTKYKATPEQLAMGVEDLPEKLFGRIGYCLTIKAIPDKQELSDRALAIADIATQVSGGKPVTAMIGGPPYLMVPLQIALERLAISPVYAFTKKENVTEKVNGVTRTRDVFKHVGFVPAY